MWSQAFLLTSSGYTNLFEQRFKNTLPQDGQSLAGSSHGFVHEQSLHDTLKFLDIPHKQWSSIVQDSVRASVEALAFMCRLRFSPSLQNRTFDTDDPQFHLKMPAADQSGKKRKAISNEKSLSPSPMRQGLKYYLPIDVK